MLNLANCGFMKLANIRIHKIQSATDIIRQYYVSMRIRLLSNLLEINSNEIQNQISRNPNAIDPQVVPSVLLALALNVPRILEMSPVTMLLIEEKCDQS